MMTKLLLEALENEQSYYALLYDFGRWANFTGAPTYKFTGDYKHAKFIDDETALIIDRELRFLKYHKPYLYKVFFLHFIKDYSSIEIAYMLRSYFVFKTKAVTKRSGYYSVNLEQYKKNKVNEALILKLISLSANILRIRLSNKLSCCKEAR